MSVLETPRILFKGEISWDPIVTNNTADFYDEATGAAVLPAVADKVKAYRTASVAAVTTDGNWNPQGTHRSAFYNTQVCGYDLGAGRQTVDPFVGAAGKFMGMLVDLEPYGAFSSQLFFDSLSFGVDGGYRILAPRTSRVTARYINFGRNTANTMIAGVASVVWQTSFAKTDGLRIDAFDSPALRALNAALDAEDALGLTVRFNAYRTIYFNDPALRNRSPSTAQRSLQLQTKINGGGFQPNPARSLLVGVVGLWRRGEPAHEPGDRVLLPVGARPVLAGAYARLGAQGLTLDISNSIPEIDVNLTKQNLGDLTLVAVDAKGGGATTLGTIPYAQYDRAAYEVGAGLVCLPLTPVALAAAAGSELQLLNAKGEAMLAEAMQRAVPAVPNLYLDEGQTHVASFQLYVRGAPAAEQVPVTLYLMSSDGGTVESSKQTTTDANGILSFAVAPTSAGIGAYVACPQNASPPTAGGIDPQTNTYMYVRTLPADASTAALAPTWANVYTNVLANWNALAPCMDNWLRLDDEAQVKAYGPMLRRLTDPASFESFRHMPVTRDMTAGERSLLYKFLDAPAHTVAATVAGAEPVVHSRKFAESSRAMRRGAT